jgi:hypothetical protein
MSGPQSLSTWQGPGSHLEMTVVVGVVPEAFPAPAPKSVPIAPPPPDETELPLPPPGPPVSTPGVLVTAQSGAPAGHAGAVPVETAHGWQVKPFEHSASEVHVVGVAASTRPANTKEPKATEATAMATSGLRCDMGTFRWEVR